MNYHLETDETKQKQGVKTYQPTIGNTTLQREDEINRHLQVKRSDWSRVGQLLTALRLVLS